MYQRVVKRGMDIVLSGLGLVGLSWLFLLVIMRLKSTIRGLRFSARVEWEKTKSCSSYISSAP